MNTEHALEIFISATEASSLTKRRRNQIKIDAQSRLIQLLEQGDAAVNTIMLNIRRAVHNGESEVKLEYGVTCSATLNLFAESGYSLKWDNNDISLSWSV